MAKGTLYLIPTPLGDSPLEQTLPAGTATIADRLQHFIVENGKTARQHLKWLNVGTPLRELQLAELNEHTPPTALDALLQPLLDGTDVGLMSEAGCPAIADPGANLVRLAHRRGIPVKPLIGPSSILLALMASGANGQRFSFHGYLPVDANERKQALQTLEKRSRQFDEAIAFIETPYRNNQMLETLLQTCAPATLICSATDLSTATEQIVSRCAGEWPKQKPDLHKRPTVFVLYAKT
ncbi:MAG: SAM-dependent methyltransferase [Chitinivorax sp.]